LSTVRIPLALGEQSVEVFSRPLGDGIGNQLIGETVCKFAKKFSALPSQPGLAAVGLVPQERNVFSSVPNFRL